MRMVTKLATSGTATLALVLIATPVHADHVVELTSLDGKRGTCTTGGLHLGLNSNLDGTAKRIKTVDGVVTSYTCTFTAPEFVSAEDNVDENGETYDGEPLEFRLPKSGIRQAETCWADSEGGLEGGGMLVIKGSGKGSITCIGIQPVEEY